eukprot:1190240-Prorocentrum_minimum.AAC.3
MILPLDNFNSTPNYFVVESRSYSFICLLAGAPAGADVRDGPDCDHRYHSGASKGIHADVPHAAKQAKVRPGLSR